MSWKDDLKKNLGINTYCEATMCDINSSSYLSEFKYENGKTYRRDKSDNDFVEIRIIELNSNLLTIKISQLYGNFSHNSNLVLPNTIQSLKDFCYHWAKKGSIVTINGKEI